MRGFWVATFFASQNIVADRHKWMVFFMPVIANRTNNIMLSGTWTCVPQTVGTCRSRITTLWAYTSMAGIINACVLQVMRGVPDIECKCSKIWRRYVCCVMSIYAAFAPFGIGWKAKCGAGIKYYCWMCDSAIVGIYGYITRDHATTWGVSITDKRCGIINPIYRVWHLITPCIWMTVVFYRWLWRGIKSCKLIHRLISFGFFCFA